jgi:hypothetical protein
MIAHYIYYRGTRFARIVKIGEGVTEPGTQMKETGSGLTGHARIAIGSPGTNAFKQTQDGPHAGDPVERCYELHLGSAGVHKTYVDPAV